YLFTTGGIGPTHDDITADAVAEAFGVELEEHPDILAMMTARWGGELNAARRRMARVPVGGDLVKNPVQGPPGFTIGNVFVLAGVPGALLWGFFTFLLSIVMIGAPLIWLPATIWLLSQGRMEWGIFMAVWGFFVVSGVDNFLKPYFISRGTTLPLLLVFCGVLGGVLAFGLLGIFIGPTLLAIAFTLIAEWSTAERKKASAVDEPTWP
ncbi:MAG TPA: AI-2E family transporter, partial [Candidatus Defluviicoccus seviourii]|nr:AI-2E family transporter [Candidatus Defluviicoccus seviourii]